MPNYTPNFANTTRVKSHGPTGEKLYDFHWVNSATPTTALPQMMDIFNAASVIMFRDYTFDSWYWRAAGSDDFIYQGELNIVTSETAPQITDDDKDIRWSFVGMSSGALRVIVYFKGLIVPRHPRNRVYAADDAGVLAVYAALNGADLLAGADANPARWYPYVNWKPNDRDVKEERRNGV